VGIEERCPENRERKSKEKLKKREGIVGIRKKEEGKIEKVKREVEEIKTKKRG
jgi:hypothetical protein